jgi:hypothetical protein
MAVAVLGADYLLGPARPGVQVGLLVAVGAVAFLAVAWILRCGELHEVVRR